MTIYYKYSINWKPYIHSSSSTSLRSNHNHCWRLKLVNTVSNDKKWIKRDNMTKIDELWVFYVVQPRVLTSTVTVIDTLWLQFGRVMVCKNNFIYSNLKPLFIERGGLPTANQSVACIQVINADRICSIKLPISGSNEGSSGGIEC